MPYSIRKTNTGVRPYKIVKDGKIVGSSSTREAAKASIKARLAAEHGVKLTGKKKRGARR